MEIENHDFLSKSIKIEIVIFAKLLLRFFAAINGCYWIKRRNNFHSLLLLFLRTLAEVVGLQHSLHNK